MLTSWTNYSNDSLLELKSDKGEPYGGKAGLSWKKQKEAGTGIIMEF